MQNAECRMQSEYQPVGEGLAPPAFYNILYTNSRTFFKKSIDKRTQNVL